MTKKFIGNYCKTFQGDCANRLSPLMEDEDNHLNTTYVQLDDEIRADKPIEKMLRMS